MNRSMRRAAGVWAATWMLATVSTAHPHHHVEQQAHLVVAPDGAQLVLRIVPSIDEGAAIFDGIDSDRDGALSAAEAVAFGAEVLASVDFRLDGVPVGLGAPTVTVSPRDLVARGHGTLEVRADASYHLGTHRMQHEQRLSFDVTYRRFADKWFVQPFFARSLLDATTSRTVERSAGSAVVIRIQP